MGKRRCAFLNCDREDPACHFYAFPVNDVKRCRQWIIRSENRDLVDLSLEKLKLKRVCDTHFSPENFYSLDKRRLLPIAVPTAASMVLQPVSITEGPDVCTLTEVENEANFIKKEDSTREEIVKDSVNSQHTECFNDFDYNVKEEVVENDEHSLQDTDGGGAATCVKQELDIGPTELQFPSKQYMMRQCKDDPDSDVPTLTIENIARAHKRMESCRGKPAIDQNTFNAPGHHLAGERLDLAVSSTTLYSWKPLKVNHSKGDKSYTRRHLQRTRAQLVQSEVTAATGKICKRDNMKIVITPAERQKRHREKIKSDPEKYEAHKKKHAEYVRSKSIKVSELMEEEKEKQRRRWRSQKRKEKETRKSKNIQEENNPSPSSQNPVTKVKKAPKRHHVAVVKKYNAALKTIASLKTSVIKYKKLLFRQERCSELKIIKLLKDRQTEVDKLKKRQELLESFLKVAYDKCDDKEKNSLKKFIEDDVTFHLSD